jgi:uncharacterized LabA/DUF88 family protein
MTATLELPSTNSVDTGSFTSALDVEQAASVAVFWDFENIYATAYDLVHGDGKYREFPRAPRAKQAERLINVDAVTRAIRRRFGAIAVHRAYADWDNFHTYRADCHRNGITPESIPSLGAGKNAADIQLTIDAIYMQSEYPDVTHVVIVSCDSDFTPLANCLREQGLTVIGVSVNGAKVRNPWKRACDQHLPIISPAAS